APASLPTVKRTLSVASAKSGTCAVQRSAGGRGVDVVSYRAPMSGFVRAKLAAPNSSDWDLALYDAASHSRLATSEAFGSAEVAVYSAKQLGLLTKLSNRFGLKTQTKIADLTADSDRARAADADYASTTSKSPLPTGRTSYRVLSDYQNELKQIATTYGGST